MNLPNKITIARVMLIPVFLFLYLVQPFHEIVNMWLALLVFVTAAATDALDGYYARKLGLVTNLGKLMDPLADKLLVSAAFIAFASTGDMQAWAVILLISREFYITGFRQIAMDYNIVLAASFWGKLKTVFQITLIVYIILPPPFTLLVFNFIIHALVIVTTAISIYSAVDYTMKNRIVFGERRK